MSTQLAKPTGSLKDLINSDAVKNQIQRALPSHMTPDRFLRVATTALLKTPKLAACSPESFMQAMLDCSSLGLEPDGRRCHLIPYGKTCQLIVDWKGLVELAKRSGEVATWRAEAVKEHDGFTWVNGVITHEVDFRTDRGSAQCYYSHVHTKDGEDDYEVMTIEEVKAIQSRSKAGQSGPWVTDFDEMAKKTVIRRHSKRLTLSPEFSTALEKDHDQSPPIRQAAGQVVPEASGVAGKLEAALSQPEPDPVASQNPDPIEVSEEGWEPGTIDDEPSFSERFSQFIEDNGFNPEDGDAWVKHKFEGKKTKWSELTDKQKAAFLEPKNLDAALAWLERERV